MDQKQNQRQKRQFSPFFFFFFAFYCFNYLPFRLSDPLHLRPYSNSHTVVTAIFFVYSFHYNQKHFCFHFLHLYLQIQLPFICVCTHHIAYITFYMFSIFFLLCMHVCGEQSLFLQHITLRKKMPNQSTQLYIPTLEYYIYIYMSQLKLDTHEGTYRRIY